MKKLTVITNSVEIIVELFDMPEWNVISTGGISREKSFALVGPHTDAMIRSYHVDKAIISCKGLDLEIGMTDSDEHDANSKRMMLKSAKERILVADHTKFGETAFTKVCLLYTSYPERPEGEKRDYGTGADRRRSQRRRISPDPVEMCIRDRYTTKSSAPIRSAM